MGSKKKWKDSADDRLIELLKKVEEIIKPITRKNGVIDISNFNQIYDLAYLMALILNCKLTLSDDKRSWNFGADDIIAVHLEAENNKLLKYWGKIDWLSKPNDHECHNSYQDPFYGEFKLGNNRLCIVKGMFGDYNRNDLDIDSWIESEIDWMYKF